MSFTAALDGGPPASYLRTMPLKPDANRLHQEPAVTLSALLQALCEGEGPLTIGEMVDHFGHRAFGAVLFAFSSPNLLPLPPGSSTILSLPLLLIAPQLLVGVRAPWLPKLLTRKSIDRRALAKGFDKLLPRLAKIERLSRPRLGFLFGPVGDRLIGLVITLLTFVLILPIPLGNLLPAAAVACLALSLTQGDGVLALVGYGLAVASVAVLALSAGAAAAAARHLLQVFGV